MPSVTCFNFRFTPSWLMILLTLIFFGIFVRLGFWQIHRADEKSKMIVAQENMFKQDPVDWTEGQILPKQYQAIKVEGKFLEEVFLLDNQHHQHQFGYQVIAPLMLSTGTVVLVDRGWVLGDPSRKNFPKIDGPKGMVQVHGNAYFPSKKQWVLGPNLEKKGDHLYVLELLDAKIPRQVLQKKVYPFIIRLDKKEPYGFICEWEVVSLSPQRHFAYAVQWFAMALVILIIFVALNLKKK